MATLLDIVKKGSTNRSVTLRIIDSTDGTPETGVVWNTAGIDLWYRREGAAKVAVTEATLAALTTAHTDGGFLHISDGEYRFDLPDAAFATGAQHVDVGGTVTGMVVIGGRVRLVDYDPEDAVRLGLTSLPNAVPGASGGVFIAGTNAATVVTTSFTTTFTGNLTGSVASVTGAVGSVTGNVGGNVTGSVGSISGITFPANFGDLAITASLGTVLLKAATHTGAVIPTVSTLTGHTAQSGDSFARIGAAGAGLTAVALSTAGIKAIWDQLTSALTTAGTVGKLLVDNVNATISSRSSHAAADVWSVATRVLTAGTNIVLAKGTGVTGLNDLSAAQVNDEVVDALATDTYAEPGQGAPAATASLAAKLSYLYKSWRNMKDNDGSTTQLYNDAGTTVDQKQTTSEAAGTVTKAEWVTGP